MKLLQVRKIPPALRRACALALSVCLALALSVLFSGHADAAYSDAAMDQLIGWGVVNGYPNGETYPERGITRAEFVAMVNRAYGYSEPGETPFYDVPQEAWYADDVSIAYNAGYFTGVSPHMAQPQSTLTREQAMILLARNMRLDPIPGEVTEFSDGHDFADWSRGYVRAARQSGLVSGYGDGSFRPKDQITRGEMAVLLQRALGTLVNAEGSHVMSDVYGNVTINTPNVTLHDSTIAGNLYITGGLGLGDVTLDNVRVLGEIIVAGGGESEGGADSIVLRNVEADRLVVDSMNGQYLSLSAEGNTSILETDIRSNIFLQDRTRPGEGLHNIFLESDDPDAYFTLSGNLERVVNRTPSSYLSVAMGTVDTLTVDENATGSTLNLDINSTVKSLNLDTGVPVSGVGDIDEININAAGSSVTMLPDKITIRPGLTAYVAGEIMDAVQAQEASADPRLLAGYPKTKNVSPVSATAVFAANKRGTVYWAVSTTTDGSIGEDELITPTSDNTKIFRSGTLSLGSSNDEFTSAISGLLPDSNYYLSAVMTDAHERHSPVKVISFATPDNTVPAFNAGYPAVTQNNFDRYYTGTDGRKYHTQVSVMTNKTCQLYYVLYPAGSSQPTPNQFRTGALGTPVQSGVEDVTKNIIYFLDFNNLTEQTSYDLYLWLTDADGGRSSDVKKLTFTTVDGTSPEFQFGTPIVFGNPLAAAIPTKVNVSENGTVFWAAVKHGGDYIGTTVTGSSLAQVIAGLDEEATAALLRKIESGASSIRSGSVRVTENKDVSVNVSGLQTETAYDIFYIAKDNAGNYSEIKVLEGVRTLDSNAPTVRQRFSRTDDRGIPYANTDIELIFNEDVQLYPAVDGAKSLADLKGNPQALEEFLSSSVFLYNDSGDDPTVPLKTRSKLGTGEDWIIDYSKAEVRQDPDTGEVVVKLGNEAGALNLKSGSVYHFVFDNLQDLSTTPNRMQNMPVSLDTFRTISAQVQLRKDVSAAETDTGEEIDMAFSMRPISVNVEDNIRWDMLLWSDTTVDFDLYWRERGSETWQRIPDAYTGVNSSITISPNSGDFVGKSLFTHFQQTAQSQQINKLDPNKTYEYAIHFTRVGDSTDRGAWNKDINFRVNIVTADTPQALLNLTGSTGGITMATYERSKTNEGIIEINTTDIGSEYFSLFKSFSDSSAPTFVQGYPTFAPQDTSVSIRVMTDRPGTIYYVVAPFSAQGDPTAFSADVPPTSFWKGEIGTEVRTDEESRLVAFYRPTADVTYIDLSDPAAAVSVTEVPDTYKPDGGAYAIIPDGGKVDPRENFLVTYPTISMIYDPNFGSTRVHSGSIRATGSGVQTIEVGDLEPNTSYYVYFVTQSDGQAIYSEYPSLFQFWTEAVNRPRLYLVNNGSSTVNVRSRNMDALADYAVFLMTGLPDELSQPFSAAVDPRYASSVDPAYMGSGYTVYMAMSNQDSTGGSLYDKFASEDHKTALRALITGLTFSYGRIDGSSGVSLKQDVTDIVDCMSKYSIQPNQQYLFVASARSKLVDEGVSANAYGFSAYQPVYIVDDSPPQIVQITGSAFVNLTRTPQTGNVSGEQVTVDGGKMSGRIYLTFDKEIYLYESATVRTPFGQTPNDANGHTGYLKFQALDNGTVTDSGTIRPIGATSTGSTDTVNMVTLAFENATEGDYFLATANLVSYYSSPDASKQLRITLRYNETDQQVYVEVTPVWYPENRAELTTRVVAPEVTGITLSPSALSLNIGESYDVTALYSPVGSSGSVTWTITDGDATCVSVVPIANGARVTGVKAGTVQLTATLDSDPSISRSMSVTVKSNPTITLSSSFLSMTHGQVTNSLTATVTGYNQGEYTLVWSSSSSNVIQVGMYSGELTALGTAGQTAVITATVYQNGVPTGLSATCYVEIVAP